MSRFCKHCDNIFEEDHFYYYPSRNVYVCKLKKRTSLQNLYKRNHPNAQTKPVLLLTDNYHYCNFCKEVHKKDEQYWDFKKDDCKVHIEHLRQLHNYKQRIRYNVNPLVLPENWPKGFHWCSVCKGLYLDSHFYIHPVHKWYRCKENCDRITKEFLERKKHEQTSIDGN